MLIYKMLRLAHVLLMLAGHYKLNAQTCFLFYLQVHYYVLLSTSLLSQSLQSYRGYAF